MADEKISTEQSSNDGFSAALTNILSNPEMLSTITSLAQSLKNSSNQSPDEKSVDSIPTEAVSTEHTADYDSTEAYAASTPNINPDLGNMLMKLAPLLSGTNEVHSKKEDDRSSILRALKPYLSPSRCEAVDYIIKFSNISKLLKNLS